MKSVFLTEDLYQEWNNFIQESCDAWFWHTIDWMKYAKEYSADKFVENKCFLIKEGSEIQAVCPAIIEKGLIDGTGFYQLSYINEPMPALAIKNNLTQAIRQKILDCYLNELNKIAEENKVGFVSIKITPVTNSYLTNVLPVSNPFLKYGYIDLPFQTQIIDLRNSIEYLWNEVRNGHKSDIKKGMKVLNINIWDSRNITVDKFTQYQKLHKKDAGRVTRSQKTFDLMYSWIKGDKAVLVEAMYENKAVGFTLIIVFKKAAYYGSSCKDPDYMNLSSSHLIQWETIKYLRENGILFYDLGLQKYCRQWFDYPSEKDINISKFKRGFGGRTVTLITSEYYFVSELMRDRFLARMNANCGLNFAII